MGPLISHNSVSMTFFINCYDRNFFLLESQFVSIPKIFFNSEF